MPRRRWCGPACAARPTRRARRRRSARRPRRPRRRCSVAASGGAVRAARRISTGSTGLLLCGMVEEPATATLGELADLGPASTSDVVGEMSPGVEQVTSASPVRVSRRPRGVPRTGRRQPRARPQRVDSASGARRPSPASSVVAASVPAAPPTWTAGSAQRGHDVGGVEHAGQPAGGLQPEGDRHARAGSGCGRASGSSRCASASVGERAHLRGRARRARAIDRVAQAQHQRGVERRPGWSARGAASARRRRSARDRAAARRAPMTGLPSASAPAAIVVASRRRRSAVEVGRGRGGRDAGADQRRQPGLSRRRPSRRGTPRRSSASPARSSPGQNRSVMAGAPGSAGRRSRRSPCRRMSNAQPVLVARRRSACRAARRAATASSGSAASGSRRAGRPG